MYAFYANQQEENSGYVTQSFLAGVAAKVAGLNVAKAQSDQNLPAVATQITLADQLANQQGISSTPSFLIGKTGGTLSLLNYSSLTVGGFTPQINAALKNAGVAV
jgi:protein-disulfide isomerase-like protein with CxxC motif